MIADLRTRLLDALVYGVAVTVVVTVLGGVVVLAAGGGWNGLKVALFLLGFLLFGVSSLSLWLALSPGGSGGNGTDGGYRERSPFESTLARVLPQVEGLVPVERRFPPSLKLFIASLVVLGCSLALEVVFGVGVE